MTVTRPSTKASRQAWVAATLAGRHVRSQEELARLLNERGVPVTQATLSRDLEELGAVRVRATTGRSSTRCRVSRAVPAPSPAACPGACPLPGPAAWPGQAVRGVAVPGAAVRRARAARGGRSGRAARGFRRPGEARPAPRLFPAARGWPG